VTPHTIFKHELLVILYKFSLCGKGGIFTNEAPLKLVWLDIPVMGKCDGAESPQLVLTYKRDARFVTYRNLHINELEPPDLLLC
jgi:hypothetical protein